jgi:hypothetical protein
MLAMPEINHIKKLRNEKSLSINGVCQAFTGASLLRTFYFLKNPLGIVKNVKPVYPQSKWIGSNSVIFLK